MLIGVPKEIKNKLERLKGDDRLDASAIKDLEKMVTTMALTGALSGYGFSQGDRGRKVYPKTVYSSDGTLSGTVGTDSEFTLPSQAKDGTVKVTVNGMRMTPGSSYDYTVANDRKSITFTTNSKPESGDTIIVDFEEDR